MPIDYQVCKPQEKLGLSMRFLQLVFVLVSEASMQRFSLKPKLRERRR
jgi:hypothetical protein